MVDMGGSGGGIISPAAQQYCLKWNNHQNNLLRVFMRLLGQEQFTDVTIASEGRRIKCHKMVLSACSSYFEQLFVAYNEPNQIVILKDTPYQDIAAIVEFMYKGEINVSQDRLSSLLKTAENLKVKGLAEVSGEEKKPSRTTATSNSNNNYSNGLSGLSDVINNGGIISGGRGSLGSTPRIQGPPPMQMMGRPSVSALSEAMINGDSKRKRGRPRTLDGPEDDPPFNPRILSVQGALAPGNPLLAGGVNSREGSVSPFKHRPLQPSSATPHGMSPLQAALNRPLSEPSDRPSVSPPTASAPSSPLPSSIGGTPIKTEALSASDETPPASNSLHSHLLSLSTHHANNSSTPTTTSNNTTSLCNNTNSTSSNSSGSGAGPEFANPLTNEKIASWGIVKMNDYLVTGTRQQYWEEIFVKNVMESVKNKEIDMKGAAELLGVSYGTLYGRYRENFGYLKHAWNLSGRPQRKNNLWNDPNTKAVLESMRSGNINIKQAAEALGMEPAMLAYQLAGKIPGNGGPSGGGPETVDALDGSDEGEVEEIEEVDEVVLEDVLEEVDDDEDDDEMDMHEMMDVQPEIILGETDSRKQDDHEDSIVADD